MKDYLRVLLKTIRGIALSTVITVCVIFFIGFSAWLLETSLLFLIPFLIFCVLVFPLIFCIVEEKSFVNYTAYVLYAIYVLLGAIFIGTSIVGGFCLILWLLIQWVWSIIPIFICSVLLYSYAKYRKEK